MKLIPSLLITFMGMTYAASSYAGGTEVGNGGHGVVCRDSSGKVLSVEVLDLYEARILHSWTLSLGDPSLSYPDKIKIALSRLQKFSPQRAASDQSELDTFESEARFLPGVNLELLPDAANVAVPAGCNLEQIVNQRAPLVPGDPRYVINGDLWNAMSSDQKAALVLHEIIYREMIGYGHKYSISARWLVGWMTSTATQSFTMKDFLTTLQDLAVKTTDIDQYTIPLVDCGIGSSEGNLNPSHDCSTPQDISFKADLDFYPSGNLKTYWEVYSSITDITYGLTSGSALVTSFSPTPGIQVTMDGSSSPEPKSGWIVSDTMPPRLINLTGSVELEQKLPELFIKDPTSYTLTSDGHIDSVTGGQTFDGLDTLDCGTCKFTSDGQISIDQGKVEWGRWLMTADSIILDADQKLIHALGHAVYHITLKNQNDSEENQDVEIRAKSMVITKSDFSVVADEVTEVTGLSPNGYFDGEFGGQKIRDFVAVSPDAHIELSPKGQWSSKDLAFALPTTFSSLKSVSGQPILVRLEDVVENYSDGVTIKTMEEVEFIPRNSPSSIAFLAPYAPIEIIDDGSPEDGSIISIGLATLSRDFVSQVQGVGVTFKAGKPIEFFRSLGNSSQLVESGVLAQDTRLKTHNIFTPYKTFKAGTTVQFDENGYWVK